MPQKTFETCGGDFYSGDTTCESGNCAKKDTNYSQCLPVGLGFNSNGVIVDLATGLIPGDPDIEHAKNPTVLDPVQAAKQTQAIISYQSSTTTVTTTVSPSTTTSVPVKSTPVATIVFQKAPAIVITSTTTSIYNTVSSISGSGTPDVQPQKQQESPASSQNSTSEPFNSSSAIPGALIGTSIGLLMFSILAYLLFMRYKSRKSLSVQFKEMDLNGTDSITVPNKSYLHL